MAGQKEVKIMRRITLAAAGILAFMITQSAIAFDLGILGGVRDGVAIGVIAEEQIARNVGIRFGAEACTGKKPIILFLGSKISLTRLGKKIPLSLGVGLVAYGGSDRTAAGVSVSAIFDRVFPSVPLFIEVGVDAADSGKLQAQAGYRF